MAGKQGRIVVDPLFIRIAANIQIVFSQNPKVLIESNKETSISVEPDHQVVIRETESKKFLGSRKLGAGKTFTFKMANGENAGTISHSKKGEIKVTTPEREFLLVGKKFDLVKGPELESGTRRIRPAA